jgi:N-acetyl-anhydromuramyl-L-alanine amidase AmpD
MREIDEIVIHCADTPKHMDIGAEKIRTWHVHGNGWSDIGYHWVIPRGGGCEKGRDESEPGAHVRGHNSNSIGICLVGGKGGFNFTRQQMATLEAKIIDLTTKYPDARVVGHRDLDSGKECPTFDVAAWWND